MYTCASRVGSPFVCATLFFFFFLVVVVFLHVFSTVPTGKTRQQENEVPLCEQMRQTLHATTPTSDIVDAELKIVKFMGWKVHPFVPCELVYPLIINTLTRDGTLSQERSGLKTFYFITVPRTHAHTHTHILTAVTHSHVLSLSLSVFSLSLCVFSRRISGTV